MTRQEKALLFVIALGCIPSLALGYRPMLVRGPLALLASVIVVILLILFAAGVQFGKVFVPLRRRLLLLPLALIAHPLSVSAGHEIDGLDFKYRRRAQYEALVATIERPVGAGASERHRVTIPPQLEVDALMVWARWQDNGKLRAEFLWSAAGYAGHRLYVYCQGEDCERDATWRRYRRLDDTWLLARD